MEGSRNPDTGNTESTKPKMNPKRPTPRHILIKMSRIKDKERIIKATRERQQVTYKRNAIRLSADFSAESLQARREWYDILKVMNANPYSQEYSNQQGYHSEWKER